MNKPYHRTSARTVPFGGPQFRQERRPSGAPFRPPEAGPKSVASAVRVKNFKSLMEVAGGEENLAIRLETNLHRVRELVSGMGFSDEMTHHVETTLGLRSGFLDQVNPTLNEEETRRIQTPPAPEAAAEPLSEGGQRATGAANKPIAATAAAAVPPAAPPEVPSAGTNTPVSADTSVVTPEPTPPTRRTSKEKPVPRPKKAAQVAAAAASNAPVSSKGDGGLREVRRNNLILLTKAPGTKSQLGRMMGLSPANMSHRLHGNKHFEQADALSFTAALGLPADWFETPRTEADIPKSVMDLLAAGGQPISVAPRAPASEKTSPAPAAVPAKKTRAPKAEAAKPTALNRPRGTKPVDAPTASLKAALTMTRTAPAPTPQAAEPTRAAAPAVSSGPAKAPVKAATKPVLQAAAAPSPGQAASSMVHVLNAPKDVSKAVQYLLETLTAKARQGRIPDDEAMKLLAEVALL